VIRTESAYRETVVSPSGAIGLMQVMSTTGREIYRKTTLKKYYDFDLMNPDLNIHIGIKFLADLQNRYNGNLIYAAAAYNGGPGNLRKWRKKYPKDILKFVSLIPFDETERYVKKVLSSLYMYQILYPEFNKKNAAE
jgi:soluble lytic murein transglycosylase